MTSGNKGRSRIRVLIVEDDIKVAASIRESLPGEVFDLDVAGRAAQAVELLAVRTFDAIILDLTLPDGDGLTLADHVRASGIETPILMLTGRDTIKDRVDGFNHGADDYLCKPFASQELQVRIRAILKRSSSDARYTLQYRDLKLDLIRRKVHRGVLEATLSAREMELLAHFMRRPEVVLSRERILDDVWGEEAEDDSNVLNVYVNYLRNKVERGQYPRLIHTVHGVGYVLSGIEPEELLHHEESRGVS